MSTLYFIWLTSFWVRVISAWATELASSIAAGIIANWILVFMVLISSLSFCLLNPNGGGGQRELVGRENFSRERRFMHNLEGQAQPKSDATPKAQKRPIPQKDAKTHEGIQRKFRVQTDSRQSTQKHA